MRKASWKYRYAVFGQNLTSCGRTDNLETAKKRADEVAKLCPGKRLEVWDYINGNGVRVYSVKRKERSESDG